MSRSRTHRLVLGMLACGLLGGVGSYLGSLWGFAALGGAVGGGLGGWVFSMVSPRSPEK
jgi:hypothetical protein